jgi:hypothetical protein
VTDRRAESLRACAAEPVTWTKTNRVAFAIFVAFVFASLGWIVHPWYDMTVDSSLYIITARSLAAGEGYTYLGEPFLLAARRSDPAAAAERIIERHRLDAIALSDETPFQRALAGYLRGRYGEPERVGPALVWRIPD